MTKEELISHYCDYRGKCTSDDVVALTFAYRMLTPRWISVEDELPPKESEYEDNSIVVLATDGNNVYKGLYRSGEYLSGWFTCDLWVLDNITHWQHLPQPPSSSGKPNNCEKGGEQ